MTSRAIGTHRSDLRSWVVFGMERFLARGPHTKVAALWGLLLLVSLAGGLLAWLAPAGGFEAPGEAVWWAFLHLSDPGYLGEDRAPGLRALALLLTVLGLALFVGVLVAVLTQWFDERMERLALGLTPVGFEGHVAILGWTNRTPTLVTGLLEGRESPPRIAILVEQITPEIEQTLRERLGRLRGRVVLRTGDAEQPEHLARVLGRGPEAVVLPGSDRPGRDARSEDPRALKILATLGRAVGEPGPRAVVEIADPRRLPLAHEAYEGPLAAIPTEVLVGRSLGLGILAPGLCSLVEEVLDTRRGCSLRIAPEPTLAGETVAAASARLARAVLLGVLRADGRLEVDPEARLRKDDRLLLLAPVGETLVPEDPGAAEPETEVPPARPGSPVARRRVLLLGWSGKVPDLCWELGRQHEVRWRVDVVSEVEIGAREAVPEMGADADRVRHLEGDPTSPDVLDAIDLGHYDCVVLVGSDRADDAAEADSRTVASAILLRHLLRGSASRPHVIAELLDPANAPVLEDAGMELVITPDLLAGALAGVITHPELEGLLELMLRGLLGRPGVVPLCEVVGGSRETTFGSLETRLRRRGAVSLGLQREAEGFALELVPDKRERLRVGPRDRAVVVRPALGAAR